jgi:anaerobic C4-dicarboxylate transporter
MTNSTLAGRGPTPRTRNRRLMQLRLTFSTAAAVFFLFQSLNADFLRSPIESRNVFLHACIAIFGVAWLVQSLVLVRQLYREDSKQD